MRRIVIVMALLATTACASTPSPDESVVDQCLRQSLFESCMKILPAGPVTTHYNDWDDVVKACDDTAYWRAMRKAKYVKPECLP